MCSHKKIAITLCGNSLKVESHICVSRFFHCVSNKSCDNPSIILKQHMPQFDEIMRGDRERIGHGAILENFLGLH